jgi:hypothetical protein
MKFWRTWGPLSLKATAQRAHQRDIKGKGTSFEAAVARRAAINESSATNTSRTVARPPR